ncbi:MAG: hypothetical protein FJZ97_05805 [Chloroflexi bacterium]|nr:hypothetical protein [Chloroflexota bacterium]
MTDQAPQAPLPTPATESGGCGCRDPFAGLPPEARPKLLSRSDVLRETRCPECGLVYKTNRSTDVCIQCA